MFSAPTCACKCISVSSLRTLQILPPIKGDISGQFEINAHYLGQVLAAWSLRGTVSVTPPAASAASPRLGKRFHSYRCDKLSWSEFSGDKPASNRRREDRDPAFRTTEQSALNVDGKTGKTSRKMLKCLQFFNIKSHVCLKTEQQKHTTILSP